jgi:hypothetical protein
LFRIAEKIGCTVEELPDRITLKEYHEWIAYFKIQDERFEKWEWYAAQIPLVVAEAAGAKGVSLRDFTIDGNKPIKAKPAQILKSLALAFGGTIKPAKPENTKDG